MHIFSKKTIREYWTENPETEQHLKTWYQTVVSADWNNLNELKTTYGDASIVGNGMVVFNIKGNDHRLVVKVNYERKFVLIRFLGTHKAYDDLDFDKL
jgi:mRNA interferase HigB